MPTITERAERFRVPLAGMGLALSLWFGGMAGLALIADPPSVVVFGPERSLLSAIAATDAALLAVGPGFVALRAPQHGAVRRLYGAGAWFVWPAVSSTCGRAAG